MISGVASAHGTQARVLVTKNRVSGRSMPSERRPVTCCTELIRASASQMAVIQSHLAFGGEDVLARMRVVFTLSAPGGRGGEMQPSHKPLQPAASPRAAAGSILNLWELRKRL